MPDTEEKLSPLSFRALTAARIMASLIGGEISTIPSDQLDLESYAKVAVKAADALTIELLKP